jgi:hypothetical protein
MLDKHRYRHFLERTFTHEKAAFVDVSSAWFFVLFQIPNVTEKIIVEKKKCMPVLNILAEYTVRSICNCMGLRNHDMELETILRLGSLLLVRQLLSIKLQLLAFQDVAVASARLTGAR